MAERHFWTIVGDKIAKGLISFKWEPGLSLSQGRKSCTHLHHAIDFECDLLSLDISRASTTKLGASLSAFNLMWKGRTVECWYQGSKVYSKAGPMHKLYNASSAEAKLNRKDSSLGTLVGFNLDGVEFPMKPRTVFYDYLYLNGLLEKFGDSLDLSAFTAFTDIKAVTSIDACQARAVCEYKLLKELGKLDIISDFDRFLRWHEYSVEIEYTFEYSSVWLKRVSDGIVKCNDMDLEKLLKMCESNNLDPIPIGYSRYKLINKDSI